MWKESAPVRKCEHRGAVGLLNSMGRFLYRGPPEQVWPFQKDKSKSDKCHLSTGDKTEAVFIEAGVVSQLMQSVHHVVMTTFKRSINPGRLQYR